jgi:antitoxin component YwqK of YwqJK toxin-antitoxin module
MEQYSISNEQLVIVDPELGLNMALPFNLPRLPLDAQKDKTGAACCMKEGRRHGECRLYTPEGSLLSEMFYLEGKLHGPSTMYDEKGSVLAKSWFCEGKKMGKAHTYYASGKRASLQRFKKGEWHGAQEYYYENGKLKSVIPFVEGKLHGEVQLFWEGGQAKRSVHYMEGLREEWDLLWNEQGVLIDEGEYRAGQPIGVHRHFFPHGKVQQELNYHTPLRFDRKEWDQEGKLKIEGVYAPDLTYTERVYQQGGGAIVRTGYWDGNRLVWK